MNFNPSQLPEIDAVEVVKLVGVNAGNVSKYMQKAVNAPYVRVADELAQQIVDLWRQLPSGMSARCHTPPFGLRFYLRGELSLQASICWRCNNIYGYAEGNKVSFAFDAESEPSRKLLSLCKKIFASW